MAVTLPSPARGWATGNVDLRWPPYVSCAYLHSGLASKLYCIPLDTIQFLPIANPFLSYPVAFYVIMSSNKRSLLNKRTINSFFNRIQKTISVTPGSRPNPITLATAGAICLNWAVTCRIRDQPSRHTSTPTTWFGSGAFEDEAEAEAEGMYRFAVSTINAHGN